MSNELFPIKNNSACVYKWGWNTFRLYTGKSSSCHRVKSSFVSLDNFDNFHNTPEVLNDRKLMLEGQWPENRGCEYCKNLEDAGGESDRTYHNNIPGLSPIDFDGTNLEVTPRILELYLDNVCDLACVYCYPFFSSKYNAELKKFGPNVLGYSYVEKHQDHSKYLELFMNWLNKNSNKLLRLSVLGGEPMLQKEFWRILSYLETVENKNLELSIVTNLNSPLETIKNFVEISYRLLSQRKLKRVDISCSLDCWGPQQEFSRYGLSVDRWKENFEYLITNKWLNLGVHPVVNCLSISTMNEMQDKLIEYKKINNKIRLDYHLVDGSSEEIFNPIIFGPSFFKEQLDQLLEKFPIYSTMDEQSKSRLEGISKLISKGQVDKRRLKKLKLTLEQLDLRRQTDWKMLFPEIDNFFRKNEI